MKWIASILMILPITAVAAVGSITEIAGANAQIERSKSKLDAGKGTGVEMNDKISTAKTKLGITFEDKTRVQITEQSRLVIDDFVYDPKNKDAGKMAMKVAIGTVRYASGQVAKNDPQKVAIKTPTASIAVRGTDFTMTVDEVGRSLVILLPSCPPNYKKQEECVVGEIEVSTDAGAVIMNQAFQATVAASSAQPPTPPKIIDINENLINNMLIVSPPRELDNDMKNSAADNTDSGFLDQDFLEYRELTKNQLEDDLLKYSELDINRLEADYLDNMLDIMTKALLGDDALDEVDPVLPNIKNYAWIPKVYNEENIFLFSERPPHIASINVERGVNATANIIQDGVEANIIINGGGTNVVFNIRQTQ
jgi:hypothetical protein